MNEFAIIKLIIDQLNLLKWKYLWILLFIFPEKTEMLEIKGKILKRREDNYIQLIII